MAKRTILPPGIGANINDPFLYNPYQQDLLEKRRLRFCLNCRKIFSMIPGSGGAICTSCDTPHRSNLTAPRLYNRLGAFAGRRGGKTVVGAHIAREELLIPGTLGWAMGPTFKVLHDSTIPTLLGIIPPAWVQHWDGDNMELTLINNSRVAFRSLEDPERGRGPGPHWGWMDEAAQCPERAWDVFRPSLSEQAGICIFTTTVMGYDWTYDRIEKPAMIEHRPGYYSVKWWTEENPIFQASEVLQMEIEEARATYTPELFAQEYRAERMHGTTNIYGKYLPPCLLRDDDHVRKYIPEWPKIDPSRTILIGLDSGADHPFGAVMIVVTDKGLVVVDEYLEREAAHQVHLKNIQLKFRLDRFAPFNLKWSANKNEKQLRLEFALQHVGVMEAENKHLIGIQRTQSWLYTKQLLFAPNVVGVREQMKTYRYAQNYSPTDGQKKKTEDVFKLKDEYPDCIRYALMSYPTLPDPKQADMTEEQQNRWDALDDRTRMEVERMREYNKRKDTIDLEPHEDNYPIGNFFQSYN